MGTKIYHPGDRVQIVDQWIGEYHNWNGLMDKYLGKIVTIDKQNGAQFSQRTYKILEDHGKWNWFEEMIAGLADDQKFINPISTELYESILLGGNEL